MPGEGQNPWERVQERLRAVLDEHSFKNWFRPTALESIENACLKVRVPTQFFANWLHDNYMDAVNACLREVAPEFRKVRFIPAERRGTTQSAEPEAGRENGQRDASQVPAARTEAAPVPRRQHAGHAISRRTRRFDGFNARYTFDRFVVGASNRFAHAAARAVAESPARAYNPLFLYGGTGLGKTHLMQAMGQEVLRRNADAKVVFISSEQFTNQLIESIAGKSTARFRAKYRQADMLLIDDIHFIEGKQATQEEFFHTFNDLFNLHRQIVISSDRQPKDIKGIETRLISRFEWGLVTDIQPPDVETRAAILQSKAAEENVEVPQEVVAFIATHVTTNIRELEGALITLLAYSRLNQQKVTLDLAAEVLREVIGRVRLSTITVDAVQRAVAERFDVRIADLKGRSRQRQISYPRQLAMYLCKELIPSLSLNEIGEAFGGKDHTTVLYSLQKIAKDCKDPGVTRNLVQELVQRLQG